MPRYAFGRVTPASPSLSFAPHLPIAEVLEIAARVLDVSHGELIGSIKEKRIVHRRWLLMLYFREVRGYSLPRIGAILHRDHTTILSGLERCREKLAVDAEYRALNDALRGALA
jgi:chromosomal replication initiation ATPase DnaA